MFIKSIVAIGALTLGLFALVIATAPDQASYSPPAVVSDADLLPMLDSHSIMIEQMGAAAPTESMTTRMVTDPMLGDWSEVMVREQEAYQAQIDRMLARR